MNLQHPKVSILMPSLNSGPFIRECLESVVKQTLRDIEIICIDAGSTDGTLEILREYEGNDPRIRVIISDKKSMGYQYNLGMEAAVGDYIGMVETDDWVEPDTFETLWRTANNQNVDIVAANYFRYYTKPEIRNLLFENLCGCPYNHVFCPRDALRSFAVNPLIWSGIYRLSMLQENNIRFNETPGASFRDTGFHFMVMTVAKTAFFLKNCFYHYRCDNETQSVNSAGKVFCICDETHFFERFLDNHPVEKQHLLKPYMAWKYDKYRWNYGRVAPQFQWEFLVRFREEFLVHREAGLLDEDALSTSVSHVTMKIINELIDNPVSYFKRTCKKYCTIPKEGMLLEADVLKESSPGSPDVSIIIPLLNEENRITGSLESIRNQTLENIEIICVDDGSEDATRRIIVEQACADRRITVLHQGNQGSASAKNKGLEYARGRYVLFLCAGDRLREDAAERLVSLADKHGLDMLGYNSAPLSEVIRDNKVICNPRTKPETIMTGTENFSYACEHGCYEPFAGAFLYKRLYLLHRKIRFIDGIFYEDRAFVFSALTGAGRVIHLEENLYFTGERRALPLFKFFLRVYSYFVIYQEILQKSRSLPYDERFQENAAGELKAVRGFLCGLYRSVNKKEECRSRFSATELCLFDDLIDQENG